MSNASPPNPLGRTTRVLAAAVVLLAGCTAGADGQERAVLGGTTRCDAVEYPPLQGGAHLIGGRQPPVDYSSTPPTSGWHISGVPDIAAHFAGQTLTEPEQVSLLEEGAVVVTFNGLRDGQRRRLERLVKDRYPDRIGLTVYQPLAPGQVVFAAWGALQRCDGLDADALGAFVETFADANQ